MCFVLLCFFLVFCCRSIFGVFFVPDTYAVVFCIFVFRGFVCLYEVYACVLFVLLFVFTFFYMFLLMFCVVCVCDVAASRVLSVGAAADYGGGVRGCHAGLRQANRDHGATPPPLLPPRLGPPLQGNANVGFPLQMCSISMVRP